MWGRPHETPLSYIMPTRSPDPPGSVRINELVHLLDHHFTPKLKHRHIPHSFCYVCSRLDPDGRFMGNPYKYLFGRGYLQRCDHVPPTPNPTMFNGTRPTTTESGDSKLFNTSILNKDNLPNADAARFKLPAVFDGDELVDSQEGRFLPYVSENTFLTTNPAVNISKRRKPEGRLSLPSLGNRDKNLVSRDVTGSSDGLGSRSVDNSRHSRRKSSYSKGDVTSDRDRRGTLERPKDNGKRIKPREAFTNSSGIGPWTEDELAESRKLKYKHRKKENWVRYAGPSNPFSESEDVIPDFGKDASAPRDLSFEFKRRGTFSMTPSAGISSESSGDSFLISRIKSAGWCECAEVDYTTLRCRECYMTGGHEDWCVSNTSTCSKCGRLVKRTNVQSNTRLRRCQRDSTLSPTRSFIKNGTDLSITSHNREECASRRNEGDHGVRFHGGGSFVKEGKKNKRGILKEKPLKEKHIERKVNGDDRLNLAFPRIDPNIHRNAYMLALADSRLKKMKKDPFAIENSRNRRYFSYFPLYKYPKDRSAPNPLIGVRRDEEPLKKVTIKKAMKHILGDIKVEDYYPSGKKFPVEQNNTDRSVRHL